MAKAKILEKKNIQFRPPVVAVLGHVDHGKTTLLDTIRKTNIAKRETGGITQHIGAYQVEIDTKEGKRKITFIDTPGHETFTKIRSRGAEVADIAILVVAVNDNIQPQTIESLNLIKQAKIPFIVAVTKIDLDKNIESVKKKLAKYDVLVEGNGGDVVCLGVSSKTNEGVQDLLEMIALIGEMKGFEMDLKSPTEAVIIESILDKYKGIEVGAIIKKGVLRVGETVYVQGQRVKIRAIFKDDGTSVDQAESSMPCKILGFSIPPLVGEKILEIQTQKDDKKIADEETEDIPAPIQNEAEKILNIILKADSQNSLEAITLSLPREGLKIISSGLGEISENDVFLAKTTKSFIIGFNVKPSMQAEKIAQSERVRIKIYKIIYELLEEIKDVIIGYAEEKFQEVLGKANIIADFPFDKKRVAGVKVIEGRLARGDMVIIKRGDSDVGRGIIKTMKKYKQDVNKTEVGSECGVIIDPNIDFIIGDMIVSVQS